MTPERRAEAEAVLNRMVSMATVWPDILAVCVCGSWAAGRAHMGSDLDLCVIVRWRSDLANDPNWLGQQVGNRARVVQRRDWGRWMTEVRFELPSGLQVEVGLADRAWAAADPVDPGTAAVLRAGFVVLHDPKGVLLALREASG